MEHLSTPVAACAVVPPGELVDLIHALETLRADMLALESEGLARARNLHPLYLASARNLLHYLALRRRDLRGLQERLARLGLSSLGRCEAAVLATVDAVLCALHGLVGRGGASERALGAVLGLADGQGLLETHAEALLGPARETRRVRILVTLPSEAAHDAALVERLLAEGMDCARINCAHDDATAWERMVAHLRQAERALGRPCRILMDLGGPKLRTGPVVPGPAVRKLRPERDAWGRMTSPAKVRLVPGGGGGGVHGPRDHACAVRGVGGGRRAPPRGQPWRAAQAAHRRAGRERRACRAREDHLRHPRPGAAPAPWRHARGAG